MIDSISNIASQQILNTSLVDPSKSKQLSFANGVEFPSALSKANKTETFGNVVEKLISEVDQKNKVSIAESNKVLLGETDNIHQSMIAMQESGVAFTMMVEVRNKLMQSYQELIKMPV